MTENGYTDFNKIKELLQDCGKIIIAGHVNPDGDAVGACLALALCLKEIGKQPVILLDKYSERYNFLKGKEFVYGGNFEDVEGDAFISLDTSSKDRLSRAEAVFDKTELTINIDHHISNTKFGKYNFVIESSSTSEIVFDIVSQYIPFTKEIAECIYAGIIYDTGVFRHSSTTPRTHEKAAELLKTGINFTEIHREVVEIHSLTEARIFSLALRNLCLADGYPISYSVLSAEDMERANAGFSDLDGIVEYILNLRGIEVSFLVIERGENISKVSFRSKDIDVNKIAGIFGGGGHMKASGATIKEAANIACIQVLDAIKKDFNNYEYKV